MKKGHHRVVIISVVLVALIGLGFVFLGDGGITGAVPKDTVLGDDSLPKLLGFEKKEQPNCDAGLRQSCAEAIVSLCTAGSNLIDRNVLKIVPLRKIFDIITQPPCSFFPERDTGDTVENFENDLITLLGDIRGSCGGIFHCDAQFEFCGTQLDECLLPTPTATPLIGAPTPTPTATAGTGGTPTATPTATPTLSPCPSSSPGSLVGGIAGILQTCAGGGGSEV